MNANHKLFGIVVCGAILSFSAFAGCTKQGETEKGASLLRALKSEPDAAEKINTYINGNLFGVQNIKKDPNKRIVSLVSIGRAPLSSALTKARAKNQAFKKADANARAEFMKWLTTQVTYTRIDQDDVAIVQRGDSLGDSGRGRAYAASEATELSQEQTVSVASGFVKGMVQIGAGMSDDGEAVVILGWNADTAGRMDEVRDQNVQKAVKKASANASANERTSGATGSPRKSTSVSNSAGDFL